MLTINFQRQIKEANTLSDIAIPMGLRYASLFTSSPTYVRIIYGFGSSYCSTRQKLSQCLTVSHFPLPAVGLTNP